MVLTAPFGGIAALIARVAGADEYRVRDAAQMDGAMFGIVGSLAGLPERGPISVGPRVGFESTSTGTQFGPRTKINPLDDAATIRSLTRENQSAEILASKGYRVEQNPVVDGSKRPDYRINGDVYDNYAPDTSKVRNIWSTVNLKVQSGQAPNIVVNLADSSVATSALQTQFAKYPVSNLGQVIVIDKFGKITIIKGGK